jgi:hypothetical protein
MSDDNAYVPPAPDPALKRLDFLVGEWKLSGRTVEGPLGPSMKLDGTETFEWMVGGFFLVHRWNSTFGDMIDTGYEFFDYDPETAQYRTHFFNSGGPYDEDGSHYAGTFENDALVVIGPARFTRRPVTPDRISYHCEVPGEDGEWLPFMECTLDRA